MATAYESDEGDMTTTNANTVQQKEANVGSTATESSPNRFSLQSFSPKTLCCAAANTQTTYMQMATREGMLESGPSATTTSSQDSNCSQGLTTIVPLLNEYYNYIETLQTELENSSVSVYEMKQSLQYAPCLSHSQTKFSLFKTLPTTINTIEALVSFLKDHSSWYNHGLISRTAKIHQPKLNELVNQYIATLTQNCSNLLLLLPAVSTGPQCPESFEELKVYTGSQPDSYTLGDTIQLHEALTDVLELSNYVMLLQGLSKIPHQIGSMFVFWIPKSVAFQVISTASQNVERLNQIGIKRIEGLYKTVISVVNEVKIAPVNFTQSLRRLQTVDSGYADTQMLSSSDNLTSPSFYTNLTVTTSSDDVFITQISPDSSTSAQYSIDISNADETSSCYSYTEASSTDGRTTPLISPPPGYNKDDDVISTSSSSTERPDDIMLFRDHLNIDSEILREIERQSSTPPISHGIDETDSKKAPVDRKISNESTYIRMGPASTSYTSSPLKAQVITASPIDVSIPPLFGERKLNRPITCGYNQECVFRITCPGESIGFVKRVLTRSSQLWPAQLHMVCISSCNDGLVGKVGQKLIAHYLEGEYITVTNTITNSTGKIPYSSCRLSKSYYNDNSKILQLTYCQLYSLSTLNVQSIIDTQDGFREIKPVSVDLVIIKGYTGRTKDEMTVKVGDHIRLLYGDDTWVYGSTGLTSNKSGFVPRSHCRLTRQSYNVLSWSGWLMSRYQFQADFKFNASLPPPEILLENPHFPTSSAKGEVRTLLRNYVVPGSQYIVRRGASVKTRYYEDGGFYRYVATITGSSFWIPSSFTIAPPSFPILPVTMPMGGGDMPNYQEIKRRGLRPRAHTISGQDGVTYRKKVSFAEGSQLAIIQSARSSLCQSNPELSLIGEEGQVDPNYATVPVRVTTPPRRSQSTEDISSFFCFDCHSPTTLCCRFLCFS